MDRGSMEHGTERMYQAKCQCRNCRAAHWAHVRKAQRRAEASDQ